MSEKIQYFHSRNYTQDGELSIFGGETYCLEVPDTATLVELLKLHLIGPAPITLNFGLAKCHPKDKYCKRDGNKMAQDRMELTFFMLQSIYIDGTTANYILTSKDRVVQLKAYLPDTSALSRLIIVEKFTCK